MSNHEAHDDILREESENQQFVQDLHSLYDTHSADAQSLARIRSRLLQRASIPLPDKEDDNIIMLQPLDAPEKRESETTPRTTRRLNEWRNAHRHWPRLVSEIAALILITALVGSVVLIFSLRQHGSGHNGPQLSPLLDQVQQVHMMDAKTGWAITQPKSGSKYNIGINGAIMRTTDGGQTWYDVTPPEPLGAMPAPTNVINIATAQASSSAGASFNLTWSFLTDFLSSSTAWVAVSGPPSATPLFFTRDGGQTWSESSIPATSIKQMSFIDAQHGWVLADSTQSGDPDTETVMLYQTADSGKTWVKVSETSSRPLSDTTRGALPLLGSKTGFAFINVQTGWIVGQTQKANFFWFYVTHDGGRTWQHQNLPKPALGNLPASNIQILLQSPTFFDSRNGVLPFAVPIQQGLPTNNMSTADGEFVGNYVTHDSGHTWQSIPSIGVVNIPTFQGPQFVDMHYAIYSYHNYVMFDSLDPSSQVDSSSPVNSPPVGDITQYSFVSRNIGWVLVNDIANLNGLLRLYQTTDGGKTWTQINYSTMRQHMQTEQKLNAGWIAVADYSGSGSKVMFLHGEVAPSKQWGVVLTCSGTGSFSMILFDSDSLSNARTGVGAKTSCPTEAATWGSTPYGPQVAGGVQVQSDSDVTWNVLVVECTNSQGCSGSPIAKKTP